MKKCLILFLIFSDVAQGQVYVDLARHQTIYDVEVVVFARQLAQPMADVTNPAPSIDTRVAKVVEPLQSVADQPMFKWPEISLSENPNQTDQWQVPLDESPSASHALAWFLRADRPHHDLLQRLGNNPSWETLHYQSWRQPATPFTNPEYVAISTLSSAAMESVVSTFTANDMMPSENSSQQNQFNESSIQVPDYAINGMLAFSKQQFIHFHVKVNLFRQDPAGDSIRYTINQKKRIKLNEWQYFDHQQFGVLARVVAVEVPKRDTPKPTEGTP